jgi:hypothetical protein
MEQFQWSGTAKSFQELRNFFHFPSMRGRRTLSIKSTEFTVQYEIYKDKPKRGLGECWKQLPGAFVPMFLLCQSKEGMKWDDLMLAREIIAPDQKISYYDLKKYADHGFLELRGHRWFIRESRAEIKPITKDHELKSTATEKGRILGIRTFRVELNYCGDPSILWGLCRRLYYRMNGTPLPPIEVIDKKGEIPYLRMIWPQYLRSEIERYLRHHQVVLGEILQTNEKHPLKRDLKKKQHFSFF